MDADSEPGGDRPEMMVRRVLEQLTATLTADEWPSDGGQVRSRDKSCASEGGRGAARQTLRLTRVGWIS